MSKAFSELQVWVGGDIFFELDHMKKNIDQYGRKYVLKVDFVLSQCMVVSKMEPVDGSAVQHV